MILQKLFASGHSQMLTSHGARYAVDLKSLSLKMQRRLREALVLSRNTNGILAMVMSLHLDPADNRYQEAHTAAALRELIPTLITIIIHLPRSMFSLP